MTIITKTSAKALFEQGDFPSQQNFADFIDSTLFLAEVSSQAISGAISVSGGVTLGQAIVSAAGTAQGTAAIIMSPIAVLAGVTDGSATGCILVSGQTATSYVINSTTASANLWPPSGQNINNLSNNTAFGLAAKTLYTVIPVGTTFYIK